MTLAKIIEIPMILNSDWGNIKEPLYSNINSSPNTSIDTIIGIIIDNAFIIGIAIDALHCDKADCFIIKPIMVKNAKPQKIGLIRKYNILIGKAIELILCSDNHLVNISPIP